jgi:ketol-acid reductoisomerase
MPKTYTEKHGDLRRLNGKTVAVIGYGNQGRAHALNLRDSGVTVLIGQRRGKSFRAAEADGFEPVAAKIAAAQAEFVMMTVPDEMMGDVYAKSIRSGLEAGNTLAFCHGFAIRFGQIVPPDDADVVMVSPKGPGRHVRSEYEAGSGLAGLIAVHQDATGNALKTALAYAKGIGVLRKFALETTFAEECEADLFGEQAVLCGGVTALVKAGFDTLVDAGIQPEVAYFEVMHELKLLVDLMHADGLTGMRRAISNTAEYGDLTRGERVIDNHVRETMSTLFDEIRSGRFAEEWVAEHHAGRPEMKELEKTDAGLLLEKVGRKLRKRMGIEG